MASKRLLFVVALTVLFALSLLSSVGASNCPGAFVGTYVIPVTSWNVSFSNSESALAVGMYYEANTTPDFVWAVYFDPFSLAAFNPDLLLNQASPAWVANIRDDQEQLVPNYGDLFKLAQNLAVDAVHDSIIITTSNATGVFVISRSAFLSGTTEGNVTKSLQRKFPGLHVGEACRGVTLDTVANDGSFFVACQTVINKYNATGNILLSYPLDQLYLAPTTFLWALTIDVPNKKLWASVDNLDIHFYQFDLEPTFGYTGNLIMGGESRGIIYDPTYEEIYAVKRQPSPPQLVRTKAYNPGFAFGLFESPARNFSRPNGMVAVERLKAIFVADTPLIGSAPILTENYIHIYSYQHAGCQCRDSSECEATQTCHIGICVVGTCNSCEVGTPNGGCVGGTCVTSTPSTSFPTNLEFEGPSPHHRLTPDGDFAKGLDVLFEALEEIPIQKGLPVQNLVLLNLFYNILGPYADDYSTENFMVSTSTPQGDVAFTFSLLNSSTTANRTFGTISFNQDPSTNKWTIKVSNWPFLTATDTLLLRVRLLSNDGAFQSATQILDTPEYVTWRLNTQNTQVNVKLINFALADGVQVPVNTNFYTGSTVLLIEFPSFNDTLIYDPDFGVLVTPKDNSGDGTDTVLIVVLSTVIPVVVVPILLLIAVLVALYVFMYIRRKTWRSRALNTESFEFAAAAAASDSA